MSTRARHSYVPFYMNDWAAATAGMPRAVWSVLFQVCQHNWDRAEPIPEARLKMIVADLGKEGEEIINLLVESGSLAVDPRGIFSPRAMREAERALALWQKKSAGGKSKSGDNSGRDSGTPAGVLEESSEDSSEESSIDQDQDQDQESKEEGTPVLGVSDVAEAWNEMAGRNGLSQVKLMTTERLKRLGARIEEHGAQAIIDGINSIPEVPFLMGEGERGYKANFDFLLVPKNCAKLLEGGYAPGRGKRSGWIGD